MDGAPASSDLAFAAAHLGEQRDEFRSIDVALLVGAAGGAFFVAVAVTVGTSVVLRLAQGQIGFGFELIEFGALLIGALIGARFGWNTARERWNRIGSRVVLFEHGFVFQDHRGCHVFRWDRIVRVTHDDRGAVPGPSGFPRVRRATTFTVFRGDKAAFTFSLYTVRRHLKLARAIFGATRPLGTAWESPR